jgi:hypothetical protein
LLPQGEVLEGELVVAAAQEREEPEHVEQEGDHRAGFSPDRSPLINHLTADRVLAKDRAHQVIGAAQTADTLAAAYAEVDGWDDAIAMQERAIGDLPADSRHQRLRRAPRALHAA